MSSSRMTWRSIFFSSCVRSLFLEATLLDAGFLAGQLAQIVKLGAAHFTIFVYGNRVDKRRLDGEDTLYTDVVAHLANGETLLVALA